MGTRLHLVLAPAVLAAGLLILFWAAAARGAPAGATRTGPSPPVARDEYGFRAHGAGTSTLSLTVHPLANAPGIPPALTGLEFLPIHVSGHSPATVVDAARPRPVAVAPDLTAVELPGPGHVRVLHYRRAGAIFGFLRLGPGALVEVLIELSGVGETGVADPFDPIIGASPDGTRIAVSAPVFSHGVGGVGDCWIFTLDGAVPTPVGQSAELTGPGAQDVPGESLTFKGSWLYAVLEDRLARAPADGSGPFAQVGLPLSGGQPVAEVEEQLAVSADGSTLVVLAGQDEDHFDLYVLGTDDVPRNLTQAPAKIEPPGYLPDDARGARLALSEAGDWVCYLVEVAQGAEMYIRSTASGGVGGGHVTNDASFDVSIDSMSGVLGSARAFLFLAGGTLAETDLYEVALGEDGDLLRRNLTATSGAATPPFPNAGLIDAAATWQVGRTRLVVDDNGGTGAGYDLHAAAPGPDGGHVVLPGLLLPPRLMSNGDRRATTCVVDAVGATATQLLRFDGSAPAPQLVFTVPAPYGVGPFLPDRSGSQLACDVTAFGVAHVPVVVDLELGAWKVVTGSYFGLDNLLFAEHGRLLFSAGSGSEESYYVPLPSRKTASIAGAEAVSVWLR